MRVVVWPSGLRRWFKAPVISMAWVRIPPLPTFHSIFLLTCHDQGLLSSPDCTQHLPVLSSAFQSLPPSLLLLPLTFLYSHGNLPMLPAVPAAPEHIEWEHQLLVLVERL